ncbi:MAG: TIR domain-containing protein [Bacilli bacterium]|nr:TIR domain-containing protein [Bacilli bacterium]
MAYTGKIYVIYDSFGNANAYKTLKEFKQSDGSAFDFYDGIKYLKSLDKVSDDELKAAIFENMDEADAVIVLLSKNVKSMRKFIKWQIEYAVNEKKVLMSMNCNRLRSLDYDVTPTILKNRLSLFLPYEEKALELALINWPKSFKEHVANGDNGPYRYDMEVYYDLYREENDDSNDESNE